MPPPPAKASTRKLPGTPTSTLPAAEASIHAPSRYCDMSRHSIAPARYISPVNISELDAHIRLLTSHDGISCCCNADCTTELAAKARPHAEPYMAPTVRDGPRIPLEARTPS